jgi:uncharacterized membrane protein YbhN (UPF0104 family)
LGVAAIVHHPVLLLKVLPLSILNHCLFITLMFSLAKALELGLSLTDVFTVGPIIAVIGAVPVTPGGLGLREFAAVTYLGVVGVSATSAMPLSLLLYSTILLWSWWAGWCFFSAARRTRSRCRKPERKGKISHYHPIGHEIGLKLREFTNVCVIPCSTDIRDFSSA